MLKNHLFLVWLWVVLMIMPDMACAANVALPSVFGDNMVLQQGMPVPVWGVAGAGARIGVAFAGHNVATTADAEGRWRVELPPLSAGGPHELVVTGVNTVRFCNVMVGEVWICAGQSNMGLRLAEIPDSADLVSTTNYPNLRLFIMQKLPSAEPRHFRERGGNLFWGIWRMDELGIDYSAIPHFFGQEAARDLNVPVGIISVAVGGTPIETWCSAGMLAADPAFKPILDRKAAITTAWPDAQRAYADKTQAWEVVAAKAVADNQPAPARPAPPVNPLHKDQPSNLYNGVIHPLIPFAFRGVIWYQGEANARDAVTYAKLFPALIRDWRRAWGQGDFPFLFVQLPEYHALQRTPNETAPWAELRQAQALALAEPHTGMAVALGLGDAQDVHPRHKQPVAHRLWLQAQSVAYGKPVPADGPRFESLRREGNKVRINFQPGSGGLLARDGKVEGFALAGADGVYVWARGLIENESVVIWNDTVTEPKTVRYAWANNPVWSLMDRDGLPLAPFEFVLP